MKRLKAIAVTFLTIALLLMPGPLVLKNTAMALRGAIVAVYNGPGAWAESVLSFERFLDWKGISWEEVTAKDINNNDLRPLYRTLYMPGGFAATYKKVIKSSGVEHIKDFVKSGGGYIGMCAGAYYASNYSVSEGVTYEYPLGLFRGHVAGSLLEIAPGDKYTMSLVLMNKDNIINQYEPSSAYMLYYGGPAFYPHKRQPVNILATYEVNGLPAIVNFTHGDGRVLLSGTHPEIEEDSDRDDNTFKHEFNDYGSDWPFLWTAMDWILGQPISQPPELSDAVAPLISSVTNKPRSLNPGTPLGIKANVTDNDAVKTVTVTIQGNNYDLVQSNTVSELLNEGLRADSLDIRRGNRTGIINPAYMEKSLNTMGNRDIEISYYRPRVEADEFRAEWYDGTVWNYLELSGEVNANEPDYVLRRFRLPGVASGNPRLKIRFTITRRVISKWADPGYIKITGKSSEWSYSFDTTGLPPGSYSYAVSAVDFVGNSAASSTGRFRIK